MKDFFFLSVVLNYLVRLSVRTNMGVVPELFHLPLTSFIYSLLVSSLIHLLSLSQRILQRFDEEGMLYLVPQGADDDWYWIYATVTDGREKTAYVVRMYAFCLICMCVLCT